MNMISGDPWWIKYINYRAGKSSSSFDSERPFFAYSPVLSCFLRLLVSDFQLSELYQLCSLDSQSLRFPYLHPVCVLGKASVFEWTLKSPFFLGAISVKFLSYLYLFFCLLVSKFISFISLREQENKLGIILPSWLSST